MPQQIVLGGISCTQHDPWSFPIAPNMKAIIENSKVEAQRKTWSKNKTRMENTSTLAEIFPRQGYAIW